LVLSWSHSAELELLARCRQKLRLSQPYEFASAIAHPLGIAGGPAIFEPKITPFAPAQRTKLLEKYTDEPLPT
jgi:hypothetical protein